MNELISVIVCTYNREIYIGRCLEHLHNQSAPKELYEVVIINNNSTDRTETICKEIIERYPNTRFRYFLETNQGLSNARNRGIAEAEGNIVAFIDDDAFAHKDYITNIRTFFLTHRNAVAAGGKIIPQFEAGNPAWMSRYLMSLVAAQDLGQNITTFRKGKFPFGANIIFRKSVFSAIGVFNINLGRKGNELEAGEEKELFHRLQKRHEIIWYIPDVAVDHIIPVHRVKEEYISKMGIGVGISERKRITDAGTSAWISKIFSEVVKVAGTVILFFAYLLIGKPLAAWMLVKFRYWVIKGLLNNP